MVQLVTRGDERQGSHGDGIIACRAAASPSLGIERPKKRKRCCANESEFRDKIGERLLGKISVFYVIVLLKTRQRRLVAARDAEGAVGKYALGVAEVPDDFLDGPFVWSVAEIAVALGARREELGGLEALGFELREHVATLNFGDVSFVERRVFARFRPHEREFRGAHSRTLYSRRVAGALSG